MDAGFVNYCALLRSLQSRSSLAIKCSKLIIILVLINSGEILIYKSTVFILGAGASAPYRFPSGPQLSNIIYKELTNETSKLYDKIIQLIQNRKLIKEFANALIHSQKTSVDAFLEHRPEFINIGKLAIAGALIPFEDERFLFFNEIGNRDWYEYLFGKLSASFESFGENKVSFLTFNYDRSLEFYLFTALKHSYGKNEEDCFKKLNEIKIVHLHGQLGDLLLKSNRVRPYAPVLDLHNLQLASEKIKIIYEDIDNDLQFKEAFELMQSAEYICFLGFGYNEMNLKRLRLSSFPKNKNPKILGTTFNLRKGEISTIIRNFWRQNEDLDKSGEKTCLEYLRGNLYLNKIYTY